MKVGVWILAYGAFLPLCFGDPSPPEQERFDIPLCSTWRLSIEGAWTHRGEWSHGEHLLLPDVVGGVIRILDFETGEITRIERPGQGLLEFTRPVRISPVETGYVLGDGVKHFIWMNTAFEPFDGLHLDEWEFSGGLRADALFEWVPSRDFESLVAYGDLRRGRTEEWVTGLFRIDMKQKSLHVFDDENFKWHPIKPQTRGYFTSLYDYSVRLDDSFFFLILESKPEILRIDQQTTNSLHSFPERFLPVVPHPKLDRVSVANLHEIYDQVEKTSMPTGLYAGQDELFIMTREPHDEKEGTRWSLFPLDPEKDEIGEEITLPTTAAHIFLVPGSKYWAVVEKGSVEIGGGQTLESVLLLPTAWIEGDTSPLHDDGKVVCDERAIAAN